MSIKVFLDMDGVLVDFVGGIHRAHGRPDCYVNNPAAYGIWDIEKVWGIETKQFWAPANNYEFWYNLEKTPEADQIVGIAVEKFGVKNVAILTSPSLDRDCVPAKRAWMEKYYPQFVKNMIFAWGKGFIAAPGKVLIDDRDRNIADFNAGGGRGILVPRLWNIKWMCVDTCFEVIKEEVDAIVDESNVARHLAI